MVENVGVWGSNVAGAEYPAKSVNLNLSEGNFRTQITICLLGCRLCAADKLGQSRILK